MLKTSTPMINSHYTGYDVIDSYVVYDPTGRDLPSCMEVGRVVSVAWFVDDDGTADGRPRPILSVLPNGQDEQVSVTEVFAVLGRNGSGLA